MTNFQGPMTNEFTMSDMPEERRYSNRAPFVSLRFGHSLVIGHWSLAIACPGFLP